MKPRKEWEAALDALRWLRTRLDEADRVSQRLLALGDGGFCVARFFRELPEDVELMARYARNRALYALPNNEEGKRGRKRKYGEKARKPHEWLAERSSWRRAEFMVRSREVRPRYRIEGPFVLEGAAERPIFLMVVKAWTADPSSNIVGAGTLRSSWSQRFGTESGGFCPSRQRNCSAGCGKGGR